MTGPGEKARTKRDRIDIWDRVWRFLLWVVLFSSIPYLASAVSGAVSPPMWERITGSGQLVITSFALLGVIFRDANSWTHMNRLREAITGLGAIYAVGLGFYYRWLLDKLAKAGSSGSLNSVMHSTVFQSLGIYIMTFLTALILVVAGTPPPEHGG